MREARAFTWWPGDYRQYIQVDEGREDHGSIVYQLSATTELIQRVDASKATPLALAALNESGHQSYALTVNEDRLTASLSATIVVHEENSEWTVPLFAALAMLQVIQAQRKGSTYASALGGVPAYSRHPQSGIRVKPDEMLYVVTDVYQPFGAEPSRWARDHPPRVLPGGCAWRQHRNTIASARRGSASLCIRPLRLDRSRSSCCGQPTGKTS